MDGGINISSVIIFVRYLGINSGSEPRRRDGAHHWLVILSAYQTRAQLRNPSDSW